ncbi:MAG TPA: hypothetical protein VEZ11_05700 [Thermoanaerobaculia bacterium]|nr:hypothetical protein [Thermoanaerobaculia bacterium]
MKRILVALTLVLLSVAGSAQAADRDMLLTSSGTLYTIDSVYAQDYPSVQASSWRFLILTVQKGAAAPVTSIVPESLLPGVHMMPALAYDSDSDTLFVFWEKAPDNGISSDLAFCSYQNGTWSPATSLGVVDLHVRNNLRIGVTKTYEAKDKDGNTVVLPGLTVHAVWWEDSGSSESAGYAIFTIDKGAVAGFQTRSLLHMVDTTPTPFLIAPDFSPEILRHPALFESPAHDTIDVVFGDFTTNGFHRLTLKPVLDGRLRIPIGVRNKDFGPPANFNSTSTGRISAISPDPDHLLFYYGTKTAINYLLYKGGWSPENSIAINDKLSAEAAVDAIRRMLSAQ